MLWARVGERARRLMGAWRRARARSRAVARAHALAPAGALARARALVRRRGPSVRQQELWLRPPLREEQPGPREERWGSARGPGGARGGGPGRRRIKSTERPAEESPVGAPR